MRSLFFSILITCSFHVFSQDISYGTGKWEPEGLGYHRAVIYVKKPAEAVKVRVPWRRLDKAEDKNLIIIDALTNQRVTNLYTTAINKDFGDIVFEPVSGEGNYYLYYMPSKIIVEKAWWRPTTKYEKPFLTCNDEWKKRTEGNLDSLSAKTLQFESLGGFHSFYPMETPVTQSELSDLLQKNQGKEFLIFPEDRNYPVRMTDVIPQRWYLKGANYAFEGMARKDEAYAWQLGIFAAFKNLNEVKLSFSDLKGEDGSVISKGSIKCINLGGKDYLGNNFVKTVNISKGEIRSLWIISDISKDQPAGDYKGRFSISAKGTKNYTVDITLKIVNDIAVNKGYNTPQNQSRLNWLDSSMGIDNKVVAPFTPVAIKDKTISVLGRKLTFNSYGLPEKISSSFTESNHSVDGADRAILSHPVRFDIIQKGKLISFSGNKPNITIHESGLIAWESSLKSTSFNVTTYGKMECDGNVDYVLKLKAKKDLLLDNIKLIIPFEKSAAKYLMGLGVRGGYRPERVEWKWGQPQNLVWIGDVNAGMQLNLHDSKFWRNEGKGGCNFESLDKECILSAFTGEKAIKEGDELEFHFALLITPFKTLDDKHWKERYYQDYFTIDSSKAIKKGATVMNIHQGNKYNPNINYPFLANEKLKPLVDLAKLHDIRVKLYYTVRELSAYTCELWALRQLDNEIFTPSGEKLNDTFQNLIDKDLYSSITGHPWLLEHLRSNYNIRWSTPPSEGREDWDISIGTQYLSRWHNYYIEGLHWLTETVGIRGLYLDGIGYDRQVMKRLRKSLDLASDNSLIDFHQATSYSTKISPMNQYMEHLPYINSLWFGEQFNYNLSPDYWLIEISGIPFGLYGEMLQNCGNAYRGMVYGMSSRLGWVGCDPTNIWKLWDYFGISGSKYIGYWDAANPAKTDNKEVMASAYCKKDKIMIALGNWTDKEQKVRLELDWGKMGMDNTKAKIELPAIENLQEQGVADINRLIIPASKGLILIISQ